MRSQVLRPAAISMLRIENQRREEVAVAYQPQHDCVQVSSATVWDRTDEDEWDHYSGGYPGQEWLDELAGLYLSPDDYKGITVLGNNPEPRQFARLIATLAGPSEYAHLFLDSFSIIENGELMKRRDRKVKKSPGQKAILSIATQTPSVVASLSPREFEVLAASALVEAGFSDIELRRFSKDGGCDIFAILADGPSKETVVVEVKHTETCGLAVLDRINGVRDRENADRAMLVASTHITADARKAYVAQSSYVAAHTIEELFAFLGDSPDWQRSPHGLWSRSDHTTET